MRPFSYTPIATTGAHGRSTRLAWNSARFPWFRRRSLHRSADLHITLNCGDSCADAKSTLDEGGAHDTGRLLGISRTSDIVEAVVVATAFRHGATIITGDPHDIKRLVRASGKEIAVLAV